MCDIIRAISRNSCHTCLLFFDTFLATGDAAPPSNFLSWLLCQGDGKQRDKNIPFLGFDVYVIGTQESSLSERDWLTRVKNAIKQITPGSTKEYHVVSWIPLRISSKQMGFILRNPLLFEVNSIALCSVQLLFCYNVK